MAKSVFAVSLFFAVCLCVADGKELLCRQLADGKDLADGKLADSSSVQVGAKNLWFCHEQRSQGSRESEVLSLCCECL